MRSLTIRRIRWRQLDARDSSQRRSYQSAITALRSPAGWPTHVWNIARPVWTPPESGSEAVILKLMDSKSIAGFDSEKLTYSIQKLRLFARPGMVEIYPLAALRCLCDFLRMRESILNLAG